jgi:hypothetical protein
MRPPFIPDPPAPSGRSNSVSRLVALAVLALALASCGPRYARVTLHDRDGTKVLLRAEVGEGEAVNRGFAHPATISEVRVTNILSRIDVRLDSEKGSPRVPAIPAEFLYPLGNLVSAALAKADPSQEVVVQAIRKERRFGIFTQLYLTSFVTYVVGDELSIHLSRVDYPIPKGDEDTLREPWPNREAMPFTVLAGDGIVPVGAQAVTVAWRDPLFRSGEHLRLGPGGKAMRREILFESREEETESAAPEIVGDLTPETLRALADLEESRRSGAISEAEYQDRRRRILASDGEAR